MTNVALIFPGQGAQKVGMGKEFYETSPEARAIFQKANQILGRDLTEVIFNGPAEKLTSTAYCQPAIFTVSCAALRAFEAHPKFKNVSPRFTAGLSLGEYSALVAAGAFSFEEGLRLVERRSFFMEEATKKAKGAMAAVIGFPKNRLIEICRQTGAEVANFNSPEQIVITGQAEKVTAACDVLKAEGGRVIPLEVSGAFHSSLMRPAVEPFCGALNKVAINNPRVSILSNVDAVPGVDANQIRRNLGLQITSSVRWEQSIQYIAQKGVSTFFEIGPGTVLKGLIRKINPQLTVYNMQKPEDIEKLPF